MTLSRRHIGVNVFEDKIYLRIRPVAEVYKQNRRTAVDVQVALETNRKIHMLQCLVVPVQTMRFMSFMRFMKFPNEEQ